MCKIVTKKIDLKIFVLIKNDFDISSESFFAVDVNFLLLLAPTLIKGRTSNRILLC